MPVPLSAYFINSPAKRMPRERSFKVAMFCTEAWTRTMK